MPPKVSKEAIQQDENDQNCPVDSGNVPSKGKSKNSAENNPAIVQLFKTAAARKAAWEAQIQERAMKRDQKEKADKEKKKQIPTSAAERHAGQISSEARAAARKAVMGDKSKDTYNISVDMPWNLKQGPGYRKDHESDRKSKGHIKEQQMLQMMAQKNDCMQKILEETRKIPPPAPVSSIESSPEQLWADSLVPQIQRIDPDIRDEFMLYVQAQTLKAIRGQWTNQN